MNGLGVAITGMGGRPLGIGAPPRLSPTLSGTPFLQGGFVTSTLAFPSYSRYGFPPPFQTATTTTAGAGGAIGTNGGDVGDLAGLNNANGSAKGTTRQKSDAYAYVEMSRLHRNVLMLRIWVGVGVGWGLAMQFV